MLLARLIDYLLFYWVCSLAALALPLYIDTFFYALFALMIPVLHAPIEALCIKFFGATVGSRILGIKAGKLSFKKALRRAVSMKSFSLPVAWKKKIVGGAVVLACLGGASFSENFLHRYSITSSMQSGESWIHYVAEAGFSINLPQVPSYALKELEARGNKLAYHEYLSKAEGAPSYEVSYIDVPRKWRLARSQTLLSGALDLIVKEEGGELISKEAGRHKKLPALNFKYKKGEQVVEGRFILARHALFKVSVAASELHSNTTSFLDSFDNLL